jgi:hypothetical protein
MCPSVPPEVVNQLAAAAPSGAWACCWFREARGTGGIIDEIMRPAVIVRSMLSFSITQRFLLAAKHTNHQFVTAALLF